MIQFEKKMKKLGLAAERHSGTAMFSAYLGKQTENLQDTEFLEKQKPIIPNHHQTFNKTP